MSPTLFKLGLAISGVTLLLNLVGFVYFFGVFRGSFQEFKENTIASLKRLEQVFFTDVKVVPHPSGEMGEVEPLVTQRRKR